ncbi:MAG: glycosyltransferase family 2 protein [Planctomycetota bacterium]|jgi:glycosyltransferase involved in cell wall biosynthesis
MNKTNKVPCVSIIVAIYNHSQCLKNAFDSILNQTFRDYEIILIDDGSTDGSYEIAKELREKHSDNVFLISHDNHQNKGIAATYQLGFSHAKGKYLAFLEPDDIWSDKYLESKVKILNTYPDVGVVFSASKPVGETYYIVYMKFRLFYLKTTFKRGRPFCNFAELLHHQNISCFSAFVTRNNLVKSTITPSQHIFAYDWLVLTMLSKRSLFYYDTTSIVYWNVSSKGATYRKGSKGLVDSRFEAYKVTYETLNEQMVNFGNREGINFLKHKKKFRAYEDFYKNGGFIRYVKFFIKSPRWAIEIMSDMIMNCLRFRRL